MKFKKLDIDIGGYDLYIDDGGDYDLVRKRILELNKPSVRNNVTEEATAKTLADLFNMSNLK